MKILFDLVQFQKLPWYGPLVQLVEHMTVNHGVVGSSPTGAAKVSKLVENSSEACIESVKFNH